jgi:TolA-binding protein
MRQEVDGLRAEVRALRQDNDELARKVDALSGRMDVVLARLSRGAPADAGRVAAAPAVVPGSGGGAPAAPRPPDGVPPDLAVVKITPPPAPAAPRAAAAPALPTSVAIVEPDPRRLDALASPTRRELAAEADAELKAARRRGGLDRAHALEDFAGRFPHHDAADNALLEAADVYAATGQDAQACALARRVEAEYPAGDAMSGALEQLAACEARRAGAGAERRLLERLVRDYPSTPAATRARARLAAISGRAGETSPAADPARSGP